MTKRISRIPRRKAWSESWGVMLEWTGDKFYTLPLLELIVHRNSNGSGTWLDDTGICDAFWEFQEPKSARCVYLNIVQTIKRTRMVWGGYVKVELAHDWAPDKKFKRLEIFKRGKAPKARVRYRRRIATRKRKGGAA